MKCQPKANNNREAVVVCERHVVKRPSKRMRAIIYIYIYTYVSILLKRNQSLCVYATEHVDTWNMLTSTAVDVDIHPHFQFVKLFYSFGSFSF